MTISLYIHIPFCSSKCDYCDFFSIPVTDHEIHEKLLQSIIRELKQGLDLIENPLIETVFIGGGTPSIINPSLFSSFLDRINEIIEPIKKNDCEFSCEANVGSCSGDFIIAAADGGVNRLSLGVQSFNKTLLAELGRQNQSSDIFHDVSKIREDWKGQFSIDLISGLCEDSYTDIDKAVSIHPDHLSVYQLSIEDDTPLYYKIRNGKKQPPDERIQSDAIIKNNIILSEAGYNRYEISNYALKGHECRHNLRYWNMQSYLGIGPSAVSSIYSDTDTIRICNTKDIERYMSSDLKEIREIEIISNRDFMIEHYLMGYRLCNGLDEDNFIRRFGRKSSSFIPETISHWSSRGLLNPNNSSLNENGLLFLDSFLSDVYDEITSQKE